jgi:ATP-dependent DNA ligase
MTWPELHLPLRPPYPPMEAKLVDALVSGTGWQYEPKWDGFRCLAFRDGEAVALQSKAGQPLGRYFPEVEAAVRRLAAPRFVLDGELVIPSSQGFAFEPLLMRIHPARSRVERLARETPAAVLAFDLLVDASGRALVDLPLADRRAALEDFGRAHLEGAGASAIRISPMTRDRDQAERWLSGARGVDGVIAKRLTNRYLSGERAMQKVKRRRTADCVVGGFRWASGAAGEIGSLLLGLYAGDGQLHYVGHTSSFSRDQRRRVTAASVPLRGGSGFSGDAPGGPSRWASERSTEWEPVAPEKVVEVEYHHASGGRFRHGTRLLRFRPDKDPRACTLEQMGGGEEDGEVPAPAAR